MAIFRAYAKVLEPDDPTMRIYAAGLRTCPGQPGLLLADVLRRTGGVYETTTPLPPQLRDDIREPHVGSLLLRARRRVGGVPGTDQERARPRPWP